MIVKERKNGAPQWHAWTSARRGFESGDQTDQIADQDVVAQRRQVRSELGTVVPDDFFALRDDEPVYAFDTVLQRTGILNRKPGPDDRKYNHQEHEDQYLHGRSIGDRRLRMLRTDMERAQQRMHGTGEGMIEESRDPELLRHRTGSATGSWLLKSSRVSQTPRAMAM